MRSPLLAVLFLATLTTAQAPIAAQRRAPASRPQPAPVIEYFDVYERSILELQAAQAEGRVTSRGLVDAYLARIRAYDQAGPRLNALVLVNPKAREEADALDRERAERGPRGPLHGIPVLIKDNYDTADMPTSGGTLALATLQPARDAFQVRKLREAGAVILGKTTMHELAAGITTISSLTSQTKNPYDLMRVPGGSSGGTGAAIGASFAAAGMGSDTCGSIRIPAANQNLVGLRASRGLSSRTGVMPLSSTQDVAGPLARSITDLAIMLDATVGPDADDASTEGAAAHVPRSYRDALKAGGLKGARIGVLNSMFGDAPEDREVATIVRAALEKMKGEGAEIVDVAVPGLDEWLNDSSVIADEFKFDLADYLARQPHAPVASLGEILERGLNHEQLEQTFRLRVATPVKESEHYRLALIKRREARNAVAAAMEANRVTALAYPVLRRKPTLIGETQIGSTCQLSATTGLPALSMPAGFTTDGLPIAVELLGGAFEEAHLLSMGYAWEQAAKLRRAPFSTPRLAAGGAPAPSSITADVGAPGEGGAHVTFTYDQTTGTLRFEAAVRGLAADDRVIALTLQHGDADTPGPIAAHLLMAGQTSAADTIVLRGKTREDFVDGHVYLHLYTARRPLGAGRVLVRP